MKRFICLCAAACMLLCGCSTWMDGSHVTVTPHQEQNPGVQTQTVSASDYDELRSVLQELISSGTESAVISVAEYDQEQVERGMESAANYVCKQFPLGAYAVESMTYEIGTGGGHPAISVSISYIHGRSEIRQIQQVHDMESAKTAIARALDECSESVVLRVNQYEEMDLSQMVMDYALDNPDKVMETPQVAAGLYPEVGTSRILELRFTYQTSREALRQMQSQVERVFTSALFYISSDGSDYQKFSQLHTFLMERFDYTVETSITPSYSLLCHGVGDSRAFAVAYAAMCRQAGLECQVVSGTRAGEPWYWNLILEDDVYYHVDLLGDGTAGSFRRLTDEEMQGYVWDYSAYPAA